MSGKAGPPTATMQPLLSPSAPPDDEPIEHPPAPPSYSEAMGWNPNQPQPSGVYPSLQQMPTVPQPAVNVTTNPMAGYPMGGHPMQNVPLQQQPQAAPMNVIVHRMAAPVVLIGPKPVKLDCPSCHASIKTSTVTTNKWLAHVSCIILFAVGCCLCCWVPYCMSSCKQVAHTCPNCKSFLGKYEG